MKKLISTLILFLSCMNFAFATNTSVKLAASNPHDSLKVVVPNLFTPNGDGINDTWSIIVQGYGIAIFSLQTVVYDRWGAEIFQTTNIHEAWSGHNKIGKPCTTGSYFYVV